jgi:hypothetical protein
VAGEERALPIKPTRSGRAGVGAGAAGVRAGAAGAPGARRVYTRGVVCHYVRPFSGPVGILYIKENECGLVTTRPSYRRGLRPRHARRRDRRRRLRRAGPARCDHRPGRKQAFLVFKRPARPYKSPIQNGFS